MSGSKVEICLSEKTTPSTNMPLLSLRKSEQKETNQAQIFRYFPFEKTRNDQRLRRQVTKNYETQPIFL